LPVPVKENLFFALAFVFIFGITVIIYWLIT